MSFNTNIVISALLVLLSIGTQAETKKHEWHYTVEEGDSVWTLCKTYVSDPLCWMKLVEYNQVKKPKYLPPGSTMKFPRAWLKPQATTAKVVSVNGEVLLHKKDQNDQPLTLDKELSQGDEVETRIGSATLKFDDGSQLQLSHHTRVHMEALLFASYDQRIETRINLARGRVRAMVEKIKAQGSHYEIITPAAIAAVRGTDFRVASSDNNQVMITEVVEGQVKVANDQGARQLPAGFALRAVVGEALPQPVSLLPRVQIIETKKKKKAPAFPMVFNWQAMDGAVKYTSQLFTAQSQQLVLESQVSQPSLTIEQLPAGNYVLKIRAVDQFGVEGFDRRINLSIQKNPAFTAGK